MKTLFCRGWVAGALTAALLGASVWAGQSAEPTGAASLEKNSFKEVTSRLDAGGNLYGYLSTEQWLDGLSAKIAGVREWLKEIPGLGADDREGVNKVINILTSLVKHCGIEDISGVGMSSIMKEKGIYRSKFVLHHYAGKGSGFLWTMFGNQAHPMKGMDLLPTTTALASFSDFDLAMLWAVIEKEVSNSGFPEAGDALKQIPQQFEGITGLKFRDVLASLGNEYGLVITLDDSKKVTVPMGGEKSLEVPEPGILLAIKVNNDLIFNRVDELLKDNPAVLKTEKEGLKMRTMPVPVPIPVNLRPSIARSGDYLLIATSDALIEQALDVKSGKQPGFKSTEEFKRMSHDMPDQGNQFSFVSERFGKTIADVQLQAIKASAHGNEGQGMVSLFERIMSMASPSSAYSVSANGPEGWVTTGNGTQNPANMVLLPLAVVPAMAAGVMMPVIARVHERAAQPAHVATPADEGK